MMEFTEIALPEETVHGVAAPRMEDSSNPIKQTNEKEREKETDDQTTDLTGFKTIQSGFLGFWNSVTKNDLVKSAVSSASSATKIAFAQVQEKGLIQASMDGANAAVDMTKHVDSTYLQGTLSKVVQKTKSVAKSGVDVMRDTVNFPTGDDAARATIEVVLTSVTPSKVNAVRTALEQTYGGAASLRAVKTDSGIAPQPIGFDAGIAGAQGRIENLRQTPEAVKSNEVILSIESFIAEIAQDQWYDIACCILADHHGNKVQTFSQAVSVPLSVVNAARGQTSSEYEHSKTGYPTTCGEIMLKQQASDDWHKYRTGVARQSLLQVAVVVLLGEYRVLCRKAKQDKLDHLPVTAALQLEEKKP